MRKCTRKRYNTSTVIEQSYCSDRAVYKTILRTRVVTKKSTKNKKKIRGVKQFENYARVWTYMTKKNRRQTKKQKQTREILRITIYSNSLVRAEFLLAYSYDTKQLQ